MIIFSCHGCQKVIVMCICILCHVASSYLMLSLSSQSTIDSPAIKKELMPYGYQSPLKSIMFCVSCNNPEDEGSSYVVGLESRFGVKDYNIRGVLVYCVPNLADSRIINGHQFADRIVFVDRGGGVSIWEKVNRIQNAGAAGIIIADDGNCGASELFLNCGKRTGSVIDGGISAFDDRETWQNIIIPVLIVSKNSASRFRSLMNAKLTKILKLGEHYTTDVEDVPAVVQTNDEVQNSPATPAYPSQNVEIPVSNYDNTFSANIDFSIDFTTIQIIPPEGISHQTPPPPGKFQEAGTKSAKRSYSGHGHVDPFANSKGDKRRRRKSET